MQFLANLDGQRCMNDFPVKIDFSGALQTLVVEDKPRGFRSYPANQPPPTGLGRMEGFFNIWQERVTDNNIPNWKDFSFENFKGWHSNMRLIECGEIHDRADKVLIVGETFVRYWGRECLSEEIRSGKVISQSIISLFQKYVEYIYNHNYAISVGELPLDGISLQPILFVDLPLSDNSSDVSHVISAIIPLEK